MVDSNFLCRLDILVDQGPKWGRLGSINLVGDRIELGFGFGFAAFVFYSCCVLFVAFCLLLVACGYCY